jgi:hypothetical protein
MADEAELEAELEAIMTGISTAEPINISVDPRKSQENFVQPASKTQSVSEDRLVLPNVPTTPLLPLAPMKEVDVEKNKTVAVSQSS